MLICTGKAILTLAEHVAIVGLIAEGGQVAAEAAMGRHLR